jgi:acetyl esterase
MGRPLKLCLYLLALGLMLLPSAIKAQTTLLPSSVQADLARINDAWHVGGGSANTENVAADMRLFTPLLAAAPKDGVDVTHDVAFGTDAAQKLDVYRGSGSRPMPVVLYFHGGVYVRGDKALNGEVFANVSTWFARHGVLALNANYRLAPTTQWPGAAQDVGAAVAWAKANVARYGGDPDRIFLVGNSAGATHIASYVFDKSLQPATGAGISGAVLISGRYDITTDPTSPVQGNLRAYFGSDLRLYAERSPINHINETKVPIFIAFAEYDDPELDVVGGQLFAALCRRDNACPRIRRLIGHNHLSEVFSFNTADEAFGLEILDFMNKGR